MFLRDFKDFVNGSPLFSPDHLDARLFPHPNVAVTRSVIGAFPDWQRKARKVGDGRGTPDQKLLAL